MGIYSKQNSMLNPGRELKHQLRDFAGGELAKARIVIKATGESRQVQFNPQSLSFTGAVSEKESLALEAETYNVVNVFAKPTITMSLELLFDATSDDDLIDHIAGENFLKNAYQQGKKTMTSRMENGSKIFPVPYGDVSKPVDFFYDIMTEYRKRRVEFAWNQLSFVGDVESISVNVLLFDTDGNPIRAKISLAIKQVLGEQIARTETRMKLPGRSKTKMTRK